MRTMRAFGGLLADYLKFWKMMWLGMGTYNYTFKSVVFKSVKVKSVKKIRSLRMVQKIICEKIWKWHFWKCICKCPLGPVTPPPILLSQSQNDLWTIHIKNLKSLSQYLNTVWPASSLKLDQFWILNFPALFSDWSIHKISKRFLWNMKK